jgi:hypothetical protein
MSPVSHTVEPASPVADDYEDTESVTSLGGYVPISFIQAASNQFSV